ncbi:MAG: hypothetical protein ACH34Y_09745 [Brachymonas sp.]
MPHTTPERSAAQTFLLSTFAVAALLLAFGLSFWVVIKGVGSGFHNRAQTQLRSPDEEAAANQGWDPNRLLGGLSRQMPPADSWGNNFGKPLAYTKGIDADTYLYPDGTAPAPGSLILGEGDDEVSDEQDSADGGNAALGTGMGGASVTSPPRLQAPALQNNIRSNPDNSPVGGLLNR